MSSRRGALRKHHHDAVYVSEYRSASAGGRRRPRNSTDPTHAPKTRGPGNAGGVRLGRNTLSRPTRSKQRLGLTGGVHTCPGCSRVPVLPSSAGGCGPGVVAPGRRSATRLAKSGDSRMGRKGKARTPGNSQGGRRHDPATSARRSCLLPVSPRQTQRPEGADGAEMESGTCGDTRIAPVDLLGDNSS